MNRPMSPDDPKQGNQEEPDGAEEGEEVEDESSYCPFFANSEQFNFMTNGAYSKLEDSEDELSEEALEKLFKNVRPMRVRLGMLENAHGSVRLWQGSTGVIAAVYGPSDVKISKELPHRAAVDVLFRPKVTGSGNTSSMLAAGMMDPVLDERAIEQTITSVLEAVIYLEDHVQAGFNVILHEYENDGCMLSACINAACLALLNAGCSLRCLFAAVTLCVCGEKVIIDPCKSQIEELKKSQPELDVSLLTFVLTNKYLDRYYSPDILHVSTSGRISSKALRACYKMLSTNDSIIAELLGFFSMSINKDLYKSLFRLSDASVHDIKPEKLEKLDLGDNEDVQEEEGDEDVEEEDVEEEEEGEIVSDADDDEL